VAGAEKGEAAAQIPQDKLQEGIDTFGEKNENYEYLTVTVNLTNSGSAEAEAYLNNLSIRCCVDGSIATETTCSEAVTSDLPAVASGEKNQFQLMLAPGETRTCTVLYYVRAEKIEAIVKPQIPRSTVDCATDAALLRALPLAKYDLAFLDIDMGPLNGVDLARRLHELRPDMLLIFVTNYIEYSLQGYEVQAFRYLLKAEMPQKLERYVQQALTAYRKTRDTVRIFCDGEDVELQPQQILYAEMSARKVCLHLQGAERDLLYTTATMADLADLLENHGFVRTHKSILVNMEHIRDLQSTRLYLRDGTELPVSSHTASAVRKIYTQWRSAKKWVIG
jgi:DNA-binding LytR/AlgR family response regulator